jgi:acetyl esterase
VPVRSAVYPGTTHSFLESVSIAAVADWALQDSVTWLGTILGLNPDEARAG